jgi:hypothetical protein
LAGAASAALAGAAVAAASFLGAGSALVFSLVFLASLAIVIPDADWNVLIRLAKRWRQGLKDKA